MQKNGTSETLRNETGINIENIKPISEHVPKHLKPLNDDQFGHYLAGLIDGNGNFNSKQELVIVFNSSDASLAYYIKNRLGFGSVKKVKDKNAFILIIAVKKDTNLKNHWLAGFSDADASFQIKINKNKREILVLIKNYLGGNIGYRKIQDTYYYDSTSFGSAKNVINYFDCFHLLSTKHTNYLK
ncbi:MAG: hypothetical protein FE78DRAFT_545081 [Acidomyces sp. 'richmondensis']|nr:MAG: hypothetical protein FE78DRAFT_545081 [Acidomyces sp. 'richmondensis']